MAMADSVPGISGGTIAFLMGFYTQFLDSLRNIVRGSRAERKSAAIFLLKLGVGWVCGLVLCVIALSALFEQHIYAISSLFVGLTLVAIPVIIREERRYFQGHYWNLLYTAAGIALVVLLSVFRGSAYMSAGISALQLSAGDGVLVVLSGALAISAMILPGISGSSLLLITGMYMPVIRALNGIVRLDFRYLPFMLLFAVGLVLGLVCSISVVRKAMRKYRPQMLYLIIGLMLGSVYSIFVGPTTLDVPQPAMTGATFNIITFVIGGVLVFLLEWVKRLKGSAE